jgi:hypothetical protein
LWWDSVPDLAYLPITLYRYHNGLFVQSAAPEYAALAGARVLAFDGIPAERAEQRAAAVVSHDNAVGALAGIAQALVRPDILHAMGIARATGHVILEIQQPYSIAQSVVLNAVQSMNGIQTDANEGAGMPPPWWLQRPGDENWYTVDEQNGLVYVQYARVRDDPHRSLVTFFDEIFAAIARRGATRLVLDIRRNHGGNMTLNQPLVHHLVRCDAVNQWGQLFVVIGRSTFSAGMNLAVDLENHTRALFVGEPTGSSPNHYGENAEIVLPHSGLRCSVSEFWYQNSDPRDRRPWIVPDIEAPLTSSQYAANRDPAIEAILAYQLRPEHTTGYPERLSRAWRSVDEAMLASASLYRDR